MEKKNFYNRLINTIVITAFSIFVLCCIQGIGSIFGATDGIFGYSLAFGNIIIVSIAAATAWRIGSDAIAETKEKTKEAKEVPQPAVTKQEVGVESLPTIPVAANEQQPKRQKVYSTTKTQRKPKATAPVEEYIPMPEQEDVPMPDDIETGIVSSPVDYEDYYYDDPAFDEIPDGIT